jgi:DNA-binding HxlR family transcriptional regulator
MRSKSFDGMVCSVADVMGAVGDRWGMLVMRDLLLGITRYDDLRRSTGSTNATLSDRLKGLEQAGLLERRRYQLRPERYEYAPTGKGLDIALLILAMVQIGDKWRADDGGDRPLRFFHARTNHDLRLSPVDAGTGEIVSASNILAEPGTGADDSMKWRMMRGERERALRRQV